MELESSGAREARSGRAGVEEWELGSRAADAGTWRYGARELRRHDAGMQT